MAKFLDHTIFLGYTIKISESVNLPHDSSTHFLGRLQKDPDLDEYQQNSGLGRFCLSVRIHSSTARVDVPLTIIPHHVSFINRVSSVC